ncbi:tetratricopeptide repeat protein (plasmid) [Amycolatopsis sp. FU40]|uniref:AAA family ATPase n=1 Tax=Amycolatopsis sp. FU40 TaxID=2914159 RepID=UPI001F1A4872|nr:NB-ARC domain-containing protein [Amycolatopsis sp. FU40]UKD50904.1 tetratricopeptide repeat protein [Amycolatopsis sp. FU40]
MADNNAFGALLRAERLNRKIGLRAFATAIHYSPGHVSKVELGHAEPSPEFVKACDLELLVDPPLIDRVAFTPRQAARFTAARPAQLPEPAGTLVGRGEALDMLTRHFGAAPPSADGRAMVLHGPPGIGKTALALRWARDHARRYPDGNLFADLHGYRCEGTSRAEGVLEDWLRALGMSAGQLPETLDDRAALLRTVLAGKRVLAVLDNVADAAQIAPLLPAIPGAAVLVLSRGELAGSMPEAARLKLGGLDPEHALQMLAGIAGPGRIDAEPAVAADLARAYAPMPLALRLLGEYIAARPGDDLTDLAAGAARDLPREAHDLREAFAWSYSRLPGPAGLLFRMLGLHAGAELGLGAAAAMLGRAEIDTAPLLADLVAARLLQPLPEDRYRFHDLLRGFAADLAAATLPEDVRARVTARALSWYLHSAGAAGAVLAPEGTRPAVPALPPAAPRVTPQTFAADETDQALAWFDTEADNLLAAAEQAFDLDLHREAWLLPAVSSPWLHLREAWRHWMRGAAVGLIAARRAGDRDGEAWCLHSCGRAHQELRRLDHARRSFTAAAAIRQDIGDQSGLAWSTLELGAVLLGQGHPAQAREHLERSLQLFETHRMRGGVAMARIWLGRLHRELDDLTAAAAQLRAARELFVSLGDTASEALALACLAQVQRAEGDLPGALHRLDRSLQLRTAARDLGGEARVQTFRAQVLGRMGEKRLARRALSQALQLFERLRDPRAADVRAQLAVLDLTGLHTSATVECLPAAC